MANAIDIISLTKTFGNFTAVSDVTMSVKKGEFMGLLGPNGAGKSTILKVITGIVPLTSGTVTVNGYDCKDHRRAMKDVGCIIETPEFYPNLSPVEVLIYIGKLRGLKRADIRPQIREVLEEVNMWEWRDKPVGKFSKGMKQRISIAQALIHNPEILIFDEPTSGLDPRGMIEIREMLRGFKKSNRSLLLSTHMLNEVSEVCDSVTMIRQGKLMVSGNVRELSHNVSGTVVEVRVRSSITDDFIRDLKGLDAVQSLTRIRDNVFDVELRVPAEGRDDITDLIRAHDLGFMSMVEKGADLEDLYMSLSRTEDVV